MTTPTSVELFASTNIPVNARVKKGRKTVTEFQSSFEAGIPTLHDINEGLPLPDSWAETVLPNEKVDSVPVYDDPLLQYLQTALTSRIRSTQVSRHNAGTKPALCWKDIFESEAGPKYMQLVKEARQLFREWLADATDLPEAGIEQLATSYFGGATLKGAKAEIKAKVDGYLREFEAACAEELEPYARVMELVRAGFEIFFLIFGKVELIGSFLIFLLQHRKFIVDAVNFHESVVEFIQFQIIHRLEDIQINIFVIFTGIFQHVVVQQHRGSSARNALRIKFVDSLFGRSQSFVAFDIFSAKMQKHAFIQVIKRSFFLFVKFAFGSPDLLQSAFIIVSRQFFVDPHELLFAAFHIGTAGKQQ